MKPAAVSGRSVALAGKSISNQDRVLITGASGWFGQTATAMMDYLGAQTFLIGSNSRSIQIAGKSRKIDVWDVKKIKDFAPTVVVDCAFLTREFVADVGLSKFLDVNRQLVRQTISLQDLDSVRLVVAFSSGAAEEYRLNSENSSIEKDPYGYLKHEQEELMATGFSSSNCDLVIPRVWSVSGSLVTKVNGFAFSDLICQALNGEIRVNSNFYVWRRYCMIEEVIAIALNGSQGSEKVFDTGGQLIEIRDLALLIKDLVNPSAKLQLPTDSDGISSEYFADGESWSRWCNMLSFETASLDEQIMQVSNWMKQ
jgi:nucleoside-diphosphate-sugar epimerase